MNSIRRAEIDELRATARRISVIAEDYYSEYTAMYGIIEDNLRYVWVGPDSDSFVENVEGVKYKFKNMYDTMKSYEQFLYDVAQKYEEQARQMEEESKNIIF